MIFMKEGITMIMTELVIESHKELVEGSLLGERQ
jgi:hypothetical protein